MTTELEKQFFIIFGIVRKRNHEVTLEAISGGVKSANFSQKTFYEYPQISDKQYLELIRILGYFEIVYKPDNCEELKKYVLKYYLNLNDSEIRELKHQVQAIFKGER